MSSRSDQYPDERYRDAADDGLAQEDPYAEEEDERRFPYFPSWGWGATWGAWPWATREEDGYREGEYGSDAYEASGYGREREGRGLASLWDEGLITLLVGGGAILFLFPEPATSGLGVLLMAIGVVAWLIDWAT